jgi:hypothetical protein
MIKLTKPSAAQKLHLVFLQYEVHILWILQNNIKKSQTNIHYVIYS